MVDICSTGPVYSTCVLATSVHHLTETSRRLMHHFNKLLTVLMAFLPSSYFRYCHAHGLFPLTFFPPRNRCFRAAVVNGLILMVMS